MLDLTTQLKSGEEDKENNESNESGKKYGELLTLRQEKEVCQKQYQNEKKELDLRIAVNERAAGAVKRLRQRAAKRKAVSVGTGTQQYGKRCIERSGQNYA